MSGAALVSLDFEGLPFIVAKHQLGPEGRLWGEARRIATRIVSTVSRLLLDSGFERVIVADSHGIMTNVEPLELPRGVMLITGFPREPPSMVPLPPGEDVKVALFVGYHARGGRRSTLAHTYASRYLLEIRVNGEPASEYLLNALYLGEKGIPVGLVAGSQELMDEVARHTPWAERVALKKSLGYLAALSPSIEEAEEMLAGAVRRMMEKLSRGELKLLHPPRPVRMELVHTSPYYADITSLIPGSRRVDDVTVAIETSTMEEALRTLELALLAWMGARF